MYRDVVDVLEQTGERLDLIMIPKVGTAADVYAVDMLVTQIETAMKRRKKRIGFELIIETALGMQNVQEISAASRRNKSLHFGVADYAASTKARTTNIGGANPDYSVLTDADRRPRARATGVTCGIMPLPACASRRAPMACARSMDPSAISAMPRVSRRRRAGPAALGYEGKWAIHPSQIALANEVISPSEKEVDPRPAHSRRHG